MRVTVDEGLCDGHGECVLVAPEIFELGDDDVAIVLQAEPGEELREKAREAVRSCPVAAISLDG